jgi:hypothetical protein
MKVAPVCIDIKLEVCLRREHRLKGVGEENAGFPFEEKVDTGGEENDGTCL